MSKIFDALQRAEGERKGDESPALPQGPDLLREAERRVASDWDAAVFARDPNFDAALEESKAMLPQLVSAAAAGSTIPTLPGLLNANERQERLSRFARLSISLPADSRMACLTDRRSPTAEAVRLLGVRLRDIRRSRTLKKVVITSTIPREGKSTMAANLACALARRVDEKVLLIEGDVRLPASMKMFGISEKPGLCELIREERKLADCVYHLEEAGIWILPAGITTSNPLELLQSQKLSSVMEQLSSCFDWIVIDSPPVLPLADTSIWMRLADGVLLVTRQGVTEKKQLKKGLEALEPQKVLGALLNGSVASRYSAYYYGETERS